MSLILDALKQADRERKTTHSPDMDLVLNAKPQTSPHRRIPLWLYAAVLIAGALFLFIFILRPENPDFTIEKNSERPSAMMSRDVRSGSGDPVDVPAPGAVRKKRTVPRRLSKLTQDQTPSKIEGKTFSESVGSTPSGPFPTHDAVSEKIPTAVPKGAAPTRLKVAPERTGKDQPQKEVEIKDEMPGPPEEDSERDAPLVSELPPDIRAPLQSLDISAHVFDEDPSRRFVFINQRSYRTGDRIGEQGFLLKEITPEGIVIDYGKGRARLQIKRHGLWSK